MISEGSCNSVFIVDWRNGLWKLSFALIGEKCILKYIKTEIGQNCGFDQLNIIFKN